MSPPLKIGLFGGSFNPPTTAHLALAQHAHAALKLDQVWWLVAPHNPDKPKHTLAPFTDRMAMAHLVAADHAWLEVSDIEDRLGTQQTSDTLKGIVRHHPNYDFIWLMGTDNLLHFHAWDNWLDIVNCVPVAVFARPGDIDTAVRAPAAAMMGPPQPARHAATLKRGQWMLFDNDQMAVSATQVRQTIRDRQASSHITPLVAAYIEQHDLYRS